MPAIKAIAGVLFILTVGAGIATALENTESLTVAEKAMQALNENQVDPLLALVDQADQPTLQAAFAKAAAIRGLSPEARELADQYFLDTLTRLHRSEAGAPAAGLQQVTAEQMATLVEESIAAGSPDDLIAMFQDGMDQMIREKFKSIVVMARRRSESIVAGRIFDHACNDYRRLIKDLHTTLVPAAYPVAEAGGAK